jgi:hypothetical protein
MDQYYVDSSYWDEGYASYLADASVGSGFYIDEGYFTPDDYYESRQAVATLVCDGEILTGQIVEASGAWTSQFTQSTAAGIVFSMSVDFGALFTPSFTVAATKNSTAILDSVANLESTVSKFTGYESLQEFIAALNAQADRLGILEASLTAEATSAIIAARTRDTASSLAVSASVTCTVDGGKTLSADLTANLTLSASAEITKGLSSSLTTSTELIYAVEKIVQFSASLTDALAFSVSAELTLRGAVELELTASLTATNERIRNANSEIVSSIELTVVVDKIKNADAVLSSTASQSATVLRIKRSAVALESASSLAITVGEIVQFSASLTNALVFEIDADLVQRGQIELNASTALSVTGIRVKIFNSTISSTTALTASVLRIKNPGQRNLSATATLSADARLATIGGRAALASASTLVFGNNAVDIPADQPRKFTFRSNNNIVSAGVLAQTPPVVSQINLTFSLDSDLLPIFANTNFPNSRVSRQKIIYRHKTFNISVQQPGSNRFLNTNWDVDTDSTFYDSFDFGVNGLPGSRYLVVTYGITYTFSSTPYYRVQMHYKDISNLNPQDLINVHALIEQTTNGTIGGTTTPTLDTTSPHVNGVAGFTRVTRDGVRSTTGIYQNVFPATQADPVLPTPSASISAARFTRLWIKEGSTVPVTQLYNNGILPLTSAGVTAGSFVPDIYVDTSANNLLDQASSAPTWNYTTDQFAILSFPPREGYALLESKAQISGFLNRLIESDIIQLSATTASVVSGQRIRFGVSNFQSTVQAQTVPVKTATANVALQTTASLTVNAGKLTGYASAVTSTATVAATGRRVRFSASTITTTSTLQAVTEQSRIRSAASAQQSTLTLTAQNVRTRDVLTELDAIAITLTAAAKTGVFLITLEAFTSSNVTAQKFTDELITLASVSTMNVTATKAVIANANLSAQFNANTVNRRLRFAQSQFSCTATAQINNQRFRLAGSAMASSFNAVIAPNRILQLQGQLNTTADLDVDYAVLVSGEADLSAEFVGVFSTTRIQRITANLAVQGFVVTVSDVVNLDPYNQLIVPQEARTLRVKQEDRALIVPSETRILVI